jgi:hypothetical protein
MNGEVEMGLLMRAAEGGSAYYEFAMWEGLRLVRSSRGEEQELAHDPSFEMGDHETLIIITDIEYGNLTMTVESLSGTRLAWLSATDPNPLPPGSAGFVGEIDGTEGEYLYFDWIMLEECQ